MQKISLFIVGISLSQEEGWGGSLDAYLRIQALLAVIFIPFCSHHTWCLHGVGAILHTLEKTREARPPSVWL